MPEKQLVIAETKNFVTRITLNNPEKGNVVNNDNLNILNKYLNDAISSDNVRVIVLEGSNGVFSRGMDFSNLLKNYKNGIDPDFSKPYKESVKLIRNSKKPVIAKIDGDVLAGGMGLALACDIVLATKRSIFGLSEVLFGIIPAYVFPLLLERVTYKKARFLVLSSKKIKSDEALNIGIVDEIAEDDKIEKLLKDYIKRILYSSPEALAVTKRYSDKLTFCEIEKSLDFAEKSHS